MIKQEIPIEQQNGAGKAKGHVWEVRHAGLLGIKYEVAVRSDLVDSDKGEDAKRILSGIVDVAVLGSVLNH